MTTATGVAKKVAFIKETTFNTLVTAGSVTSAQYLRRVTSDIDLSKDTYSSNEIRTDYQVADMRHGMRKVGGTLKAELSPGSFQGFMQAMFRKNFTAVSADAAIASLTLALVSTGLYSIQRASGYLAKGYKAGMVVRITDGWTAGQTASYANLNKNLFITDCTDTLMTVMPWGDQALFITTNAATATIAASGKYTYTPETGHTSDSFQIEHWYSDISRGEVFSGCRIDTMDINLPSTGMATVDFGVLGANMNTGINGTWAGTSQYFSSPTAANSIGVLTGVSGVLRVGGSTMATVTGISFKAEGGMSVGSVVGSNVTPDVFPGRVKVSGQLTAYFDSVTLRDLFLHETKFEVLAALYSTTADASDFISFGLYNCKANGASKSDGEQGLIVTMPFVGLFNGTPATNTTDDTLRTTMMVQDSQAA